jgi:hypothetical protein
MGQSNFSGPVKSTAGFIAGSNGTTITKILKGTVAVTVSTLAAAAEEDIAVAVTGAALGDSVSVNPTVAAAETGLAVLGAWVSDADEITIRVGNTDGSALDGSTANWTYLIIKS